MNSAILEAKKQQVNELAEKFKNSVSCVVVDPRGLTVQQSTELRKQLRNEGVELKVIKNNISARAASEAGYEEMSKLFVGPSAIAFSENDAVAPAKIIYEFSSKNESLQLKGGFIEKRNVSIEQLAEVAKLPNKDGMLSMLLSVLQAPMRNLAYAVKQIAEKDNQTEVSE
ncbi:50S ribosomal protein L10 [Mycoplasmatota bacterium]|nr:50S ribosomal protein L10 [Mycoplasmatota bacterium]